MTTERDPQTRLVLSWLREDGHENADRMLLRALDEVDTTPQRRPSWPAWRSPHMLTLVRLASAAAAALVLAVVGLQLLTRPTGPAASTKPTVSLPTPTGASVTFHPREATFSSPMQGLTTDYPAGWQVRPATHSWSGGALSFDSPEADVIFDPAYRDGLFLLMASMPVEDGNDAWADAVYLAQCPFAASPDWPTRAEPAGRVDGFDLTSRDCLFTEIATLRTERRGYLFQLVVSSANAAELGDTYDYSWLRAVLDTVALHPDEALGAAPSASPPPLAMGSFLAKGGRVELAAYPDGSGISGTFVYGDPANPLDGFSVDLECMRTTLAGLIMFGGTTSRTTSDSTPSGTRVALVLQAGSPVKAFIHHEYPDPPLATCGAFLNTILDIGDPGFDASVLEPIDGRVDLPA